MNGTSIPPSSFEFTFSRGAPVHQFLRFVGNTVGFANRDICATLMKSAIFDCKNERPQISNVTVFRPHHLGLDVNKNDILTSQRNPNSFETEYSIGWSKTSWDVKHVPCAT